MFQTDNINPDFVENIRNVRVAEVCICLWSVV